MNYIYQGMSWYSKTIDSLNFGRQEWTYVCFGVAVLGFLLMRGLGGKSNL